MKAIEKEKAIADLREKINLNEKPIADIRAKIAAIEMQKRKLEEARKALVAELIPIEEEYEKKRNKLIVALANAERAPVEK